MNIVAKCIYIEIDQTQRGLFSKFAFCWGLCPCSLQMVGTLWTVQVALCDRLPREIEAGANYVRHENLGIYVRDPTCGEYAH